MLVDYWDEQWLPFCDEVLESLLSEGIQPILAHPERMPQMDDPLEELLTRLLARGVLLQGNLRCIAGAEASVPQTRMQRWLADDRYAMLATDMHTPHCLDDRLDGIPVVDEQVGTSRLLKLLGGNTGALIRLSRAASGAA